MSQKYVAGIVQTTYRVSENAGIRLYLVRLRLLDLKWNLQQRRFPVALH